MLNIIRKLTGRSPASIEASLDILADAEIYGVSFTKHELVMLFLDWTQREDYSAMTRDYVGKTLKKNPKIKALMADKPLHVALQTAGYVEQAVIDHFMKKKLVRGSKKGASTHRITDTGQQVRQYYVLKLGLRGSVLDRMKQFA